MTPRQSSTSHLSKMISRALTLTLWVAAVGAAACDGDAIGRSTQALTSCDGAKKDAGGRCRLPDGRFAKKACCEASTGCHEAFAAAIDACVIDQQVDGDLDPATTTLWDLTAACADLEPMAGVRDAICAGEGAPFCALDLEQLAAEVLPGCRREAEDRMLDATCIFGTTWREALGSEAIVVVGERRLHAGDPLAPGQAAQIREAVRQSSYEPTSIAEAFAAVDQGEVVYVELWDASARRAFTAYEYGAGDNSYGAIFVHGTTTIAASIGDGELLGCASFWGPERRRCQADADCVDGTACLGSSAASPLGRCLAPALDVHPAEGAVCSRADLDFGCPGGSGLRCAADSGAAAGSCLPAWMTGSFESKPELPIPDGTVGGIETQLLVYGLATVGVEVRIDLLVSHPQPEELRITLENPAGTEVVVVEGVASPNGELLLDDVRLEGFPGDESVNGVWRLRAFDVASGAAGTVHRFGLTIGSRWD